MSRAEIKNIRQWLDGQTIFITGSSGFVGKILVYKLLKSCKSVKAIYLLLRKKKGKTATERLKELFASSIFDQMKIDDEETFKKVKIIEGDVTEKNLGINQSDWEMLQNNVTFIINAAASVRFDDSLKKAVFTNTRSAKYALILAKGTKHLKVFVHVSTLYSNCHRKYIPEKVILTGTDPDKMIKVAEELDEHQLEVFTRKILNDFPNTYVYTKNLAEELIYRERDRIPLVIYRPGIVFTSTREPEPGYCDNLNSLAAFAAAGGKGILRFVHGTDRGTFLLINTDTCVNGMLIAAWHRDMHLSSEKGNTDDKIVYNVADYQLSLRAYVEYLQSMEYYASMKGQLFKAHCSIISSPTLFKIATIFLHLTRGVLIDTILKMMGQKPRVIKIYRRIYTSMLNLYYFMSNKWTIENDNFKKLEDITPEDEKRIFYTSSLFEIDFDRLMHDFSCGVRKHLGYTPKPTDEEVRHTFKLHCIDIALKLICLGLFIWWLPMQDIFDWSVNKVSDYCTSWSQFLEKDDI